MGVDQRQNRRNFCIWLLRSSFSVLVVLFCSTPVLEQGLFPSLVFGEIVILGKKVPLGLELLLVLIISASFIGSWLLADQRLKWRWGHWSSTVPVIGFGMIAIIRSWPIHDPTVALVSVFSIVFFWAIYFFTVQFLPRQWIIGIMAIILLIQGLFGVLQFITQGSVGLKFTQELTLDPAIRGVSVIETAGRRWLRAYGLTPHPNFLGGYLGLGLLLCLGAWLETVRYRWLLPMIISGGIAFLFTFSRSAWLGFALGLLYGVLLLRLWQRIDWHDARVRRRIIIAGSLLLTLVFVFGMVFRELLVARFLRLEQTLEVNSVQERVRDARQAWMLIRNLPLRGVGTGYYVQALWAWANTTGLDFPAFQPVHNIPLLVTAEMGAVGLAFWLWLLINPPLKLVICRSNHMSPLTVAWAAAFVLFFTVSLFDIYLYIPNVWWSSIYIGLLLGGWSRSPRIQGECVDQTDV